MVFWYMSILLPLFFFLSLFYFVPKLLLANRRRRKHLDKIVSENGWQIDRTVREHLPAELANETISNMGDPETYHSFNAYLIIRGRYRGREFLLLSHGKRRHRRTDGSGTTFIFTKASGNAAFVPFFVHQKSALMDSMLQMDAGVKKMDRSVKSTFFSKISMPKPFSESYTLRGLRGAANHLTEDVQQALLDRPDMFRRMDEKWYHRFSIYPGVSERYVWIDIQEVIPDTLFSRLDILMDWADIIAPTSIEGAGKPCLNC
ncbi:MAG: hypothetical protein AAFN76_12015 [Pseudomonadota bacterium]